MHRGKVANALLPQIIIEQKADIAIISEQHSKITNGLWTEDDTGTAAIWIPFTSRLTPKKTGKGNCFTWVQIENLTLVSCYLTPSDNIDMFQAKLDGIEDYLRETLGDIIVAGDFNARAAEWGMQSTNSRGRRIVEMIARVGLIVANTGNIPTLRRPGCEGTIPDITLVSERTANKITNWRVLEIYTGSDHQYISYSIKSEVISSRFAEKPTRSTRKWIAEKLNPTALLAEIDRRLSEVSEAENACTTAEKVMKIITKSCDKSMPRAQTNKPGRKAVHWWNDDIANARRDCFKYRRKYTRARRRGDAEIEKREFKDAKKRLQENIFDSKRRLWEALREDINRNPWGTGYKIVMEKLGTKSPTQLMNEEKMTNIVTSLFPSNEAPMDEPEIDTDADFPLFTTDELKNAADKLKPRKTPGPDGVPSEVIKEIAHKRPELLLNMFNRCLTEGQFPKIWKVQQLVLISKGKGDPDLPSAYRPLCMLDTAGKLLERLLKPRLNEAINATGGLSDRQHGFRPGRSTIGALKDAVDAFEAAQQKTHYSRPLILLATLDVKNAFNSLRWPDVIRALERKFHVPAYLSRIIRNYLKDRELVYNTTEGQRRIQVTSGAAQGSILGPDLWNISYDEILRIEMPGDTFLVGYADDIAAVISARDSEEAKRKLRQVMIRTMAWLDSHGLRLATQKTEVLLLTRRHIPVEIDIDIGDISIRTKRCVNYLGIRLDPKLTYSNQTQHATTKAAKTTAQLSRLMANVGGPLQNKRRLLMEASNSILLYGCEIWGEITRWKKRSNALLAVQRASALRITSAYRTVSAAAVLVIAGTIPIDLKIQEKMKIWKKKKANTLEEGDEEEIRQGTLQAWQTRWSGESKARWTTKLLPHLRNWLERKTGDVNYYLTQMLTGHGYFRKYLYKIGKCSTPYCLYEEEDTIDDAEHTFFGCSRWSQKRTELGNVTGSITAENLIEIMVGDEKNWRAIAQYCEDILRCKKPDLDAAEATSQFISGGLDAGRNTVDD